MSNVMIILSILVAIVVVIVTAVSIYDKLVNVCIRCPICNRVSLFDKDNLVYQAASQSIKQFVDSNKFPCSHMRTNYDEFNRRLADTDVGCGTELISVLVMHPFVKEKFGFAESHKLNAQNVMLMIDEMHKEHVEQEAAMKDTFDKEKIS